MPKMVWPSTCSLNKRLTRGTLRRNFIHGRAHQSWKQKPFIELPFSPALPVTHLFILFTSPALTHWKKWCMLAQREQIFSRRHVLSICTCLWRIIWVKGGPMVLPTFARRRCAQSTNIIMQIYGKDCALTNSRLSAQTIVRFACVNKSWQMENHSMLFPMELVA